MNTSRLLIAIFILFYCAVPIQAQTFEILPQGQYEYLPSPESPGIPECLPSQFLCSFGISGSVTVVADANSLSFTATDLELLGNEAVQNNPPSFAPVTVDSVSDLLLNNGESLSLVSDVNGVLTYEFEFFSFNDLVLAAVIDGDELRVTGGRDLTAGDGDGFDFNFAATQAVPEPSSACLLCCLGVLSTLSRRRT